MATAIHKAIANPQAFSDAVDAYLKSCTHDDSGTLKAKPDLATLEGLGLAVGVYEPAYWSRWKERYNEPTEHDPACLISQAIKRAKAFSAQQLKQDCFKSKSAMALALGKCMHGWIEQQHIKVDAKVSGSISVATGVTLAGDA